MSKVPSLPYTDIVRALQKAGWTGIRQRGSHIRMHRITAGGEVLRVTVPAHKPVKRSTLAHILKQVQLDVDEFLKLL